jgi:adenosylcobinamide kinase / adenosylcobinamide-phosphate guanylyltransferase
MHAVRESGMPLPAPRRRSMNHVTLILGGARSGKSRFALEEGSKHGRSKIYIATARPLDPEMTRRIEQHRWERPPDWTTIEEPERLSDTLRAVEGRADVAVIDCLTLWLSNLLIKTKGDEPFIRDEIERFIKVAGRVNLRVIAVSNEVGLGIVPADPLSRHFRDLAGWLHQRLARSAHRVYWMTAGIAVTIKRGHDAQTQ